MTVRRVALGDLGRFVGGGTPSRKVPEYFAGQIPWATVKDFKSDRISSTREHLSEAGLKNSSSRLVPKGSLLIVSRMGLGKAAIAEVDVAINQDIKAFIPNGDHDIEFLLWCLKALAPEIERRGAGATVKGITLQDISSLPIPLPSIEEQRRIVDILNRAASIERLKARASAHLRDFIPALFLKMFGDPIENPMGWPTSTLGDLVKFQSGGTPNKKRPDFWGGDVPWVSPKDMKPDVITSSIDSVSAAALAETSLKMVPTSAVLIVVRGMILAHTVPIRRITLPVTINQDMKAIIPSEDLVPDFLRWHMQMQHDHLLRAVSTAGHGTKRIEMSVLQDLVVQVPPIEHQKAFTDLLDAAMSKVELSRRAGGLADGLSRSLLDKLLTMEDAA